MLYTLFVSLFLVIARPVIAQTASPTSAALSSTEASVAASSITSSAAPSITPPPSTASSSSSVSSLSSISINTTSAGSTAPDVYLNVPNLSVGRIELDVDNLQADINLNAQVASLVTINAGVAVSVTKVNLTITDVEAQLELIVRLGNLVEIVQRVFQSLDLNPLLITALNDVTDVVEAVVGAVDGLLGSITQGGTTLNFLIDNLGNIVQEVVGVAGNVSTIVGNYVQNMTYTGVSQTLQNGDIQKTYSYSPLNALVNIIFNSLGQVVQATVAKGTSTGTSSTSSTLPTSTAT
jgi:hypothetical protein